MTKYYIKDLKMGRNMAYQDKLHNLKVEFMNQKAKIRLKPQTALAVHIDFDVLLNTDLNWIIKEIRKAIKEEIQSYIQ